MSPAIRITSAGPAVTHVQVQDGTEYPVGENIDDVPEEHVDQIKSLDYAKVRTVEPEKAEQREELVGDMEGTGEAGEPGFAGSANEP